MSNYINRQSIKTEKHKKQKFLSHHAEPPFGGQGGLHLKNPHFKISNMWVVISGC